MIGLRAPPKEDVISLLEWDCLLVLLNWADLMVDWKARRKE